MGAGLLTASLAAKRYPLKLEGDQMASDGRDEVKGRAGGGVEKVWRRS
jgi:hypothetical protein